MPPDEKSAPSDEAVAGVAEEREERAERGGRLRFESLVPDLVKKTFYAGLGAVLNSEDGIRKMASELTVPKDVAGYLISSVQATKDEVFKIVARETREFLSNMNVNQELARLLTQVSLEIKTEIRFIPNDQAASGVKPDIKKKISVKRAKQQGASASAVGATADEVADGDADGDDVAADRDRGRT
ncbi:MAG: hypothetical protein EXR73_07125 [Myxococcales bacterium]|nr:hypothetical protein [Myxococcales bacterium]